MSAGDRMPRTRPGSRKANAEGLSAVLLLGGRGRTIELSVKKRFGEFSIDASMHDEGFICLSGRNGAGKTSLLRIVAGILAPDEGYVKVGGETITHLPMEKRSVVLVTQDSYLPGLEVREHLVWGARARRIEVEEKEVSDAAELLGIRFTGKVEELSTGNRVRVSLATSLLSRPRVILVDEAFANLDRREEVMEGCRKLASGFSDLLFTAQRPAERGEVDHLYTMESGVLSRAF